MIDRLLLSTALIVSSTSIISLSILSYTLSRILRFARPDFPKIVLPSLVTVIFAYCLLPLEIIKFGRPLLSIALSTLGLIVLFLIGLKGGVGVRRLLKFSPILFIVYNVPTALKSFHNFLLMYLVEVFAVRVRIADRFYYRLCGLSKVLFALNTPAFTLFYYMLSHGCLNVYVVLFFSLTWITAWLSTLYTSLIVYDVVRRWS